MTFSVSKLETQLSSWFASVLCHVPVYCRAGGEVTPFTMIRLQRTLPAKARAWQKIPGEGGEWGSELPPGLGRGWERVKASNFTRGRPRSVKQVQR